MVETWEYTEEDYVFPFGEPVIAAAQRPETHICISISSDISVTIETFKRQPVLASPRSNLILLFASIFLNDDKFDPHQIFHLARFALSSLLKRNQEWTSSLSCWPML